MVHAAGLTGLPWRWTGDRQGEDRELSQQLSLSCMPVCAHWSRPKLTSQCRAGCLASMADLRGALTQVTATQLPDRLGALAKLPPDNDLLQ